MGPDTGILRYFDFSGKVSGREIVFQDIPACRRDLVRHEDYLRNATLVRKPAEFPGNNHPIE